jgi:sodium/bile acid cotransporter 7
VKTIRLTLLIWGCTAAWILAGSGGFQARADDAMSEAGKRAQIEALYRGYKKDFADVQDIAPAEAMELSNAGRVVFVDVREEKEQAVSMLPGAVTETEFLERREQYGDKVIIGYCTISYRSGRLAQELRARGIEMLNLEGGLLAWVHAGGKVFGPAGETRRIHVYGRKWNLGPRDYEAIW